MTTWAKKKKQGEIPEKPHKIWTRLLMVDKEQSLYETAVNQMFVNKSPPYEPEDFHDMRLPDKNDLDPHTILTYGTTISHLRTCLVGDTNNPFHDFARLT